MTKIHNIIAIALLIIIFALFFFNFFGLSEKTPIFLLKISDSVIILPIKFFSIISNKTTDFFGLFTHIGDLKRENERLYSENQKFIVENIKLRELETENESFRTALNLEKSKEYDLLPARIIGKDPAALTGFVVIDKGGDSGVFENAAVISQNGVLIGQIKKVNLTSSQFISVAASGSSVNAIIQGSRIQGILRGKYGISLILELVPQDKEVQIDEAVITSGINDGFPQGILIGFVDDILADANKPFKNIIVRSGEKIANIEWVYVLKN